MPRIDTILICDDVREELGGKLSLLGLYRDIEIHEAAAKAKAEKERQAYTAASGNLAALKSYVNTCELCSYRSQAQADILRSYELHANAYVVKPFDAAQFTDAIRQIDDFFLTLVKRPQ